MRTVLDITAGVAETTSYNATPPENILQTMDPPVQTEDSIQQQEQAFTNKKVFAVLIGSIWIVGAAFLNAQAGNIITTSGFG